MSLDHLTLIDILKEAFETRNKKKSSEYITNICTFFENYYGGRNTKNKDEYKNILNTTILELKNNSENFTFNIVDGVRSFPNDKYNLTKRLEVVFKRLTHYGLVIEKGLLDNFKYRDRNERLLMILKHLHEGEKSRDEIADTFGISNRALADDISTLLNGFEFMGSTMKIEELERKKNTYKSIIHPIFLALNSAEIYSMTIGLKKISRGTMFEDTLGRVADAFYTQLSDYAKGLVDNQKDAQQLNFNSDDLQFINSNDLLRKSKLHLVYFLKDQVPCKVNYMDEGNILIIKGTLHLPEHGKYQEEMVILKSEYGDKIIKASNILEISRLE